MEVNERIFKFGADIRQFLPDRILINCVTPQQTEDMFSVLWHTRGTLITSEKAVHNIYISILGGDYMDFHIAGDESPAAFSSGIVRVALKENAGAFFPGIIVFRQPMNGKTFYRFRYTNVSEANRQALFFAMLQKQLGMRAVVARAAPRAHPDTQAGPGAWRAAAIVVFGKIM